MEGHVLGWIVLLWLAAEVEGLQVTVPEKKKVAMLFQPALLRCHFSTSSTQPAVVQWRYKSYCQDRMGEALGMATSGVQTMSKRNLDWDPYLDCVDSRRTVRVVASKQGSAVTIGDFYKERDVSIVHDADLQIGKLMWGDSGLYYCLIITPDDVEGKNEESVELLVLDNNTISELSSLHEDDLNFRQPYRQARRKPLPPAGDLDGDAEYWAGVIGGGSTSRSQAVSDYRDERDSFRHSQQRSKSEMLSRKSFSVGVPAVSMDELAAFAESYSQRARRADSQETRRFERSESRGGGLHHQDSSLEEYYTKRSRGNREPLTDSDRGWSYSPPRRRAHEEKHLPRLVSRTPGGSQKYDHSYLSSVLERKSRSYDESGDRCETPSKLSSQPSQRGGGTYYAWSPPSTYKPEPSQQQSQSQSSDQEDGEDTLPPYSERELSRGPSYRAREQAYLNASDKKRKKEPKKTVRPCLVLLIQIR
uniref:Immunoglobulin like domain containing receptor 2 n=1 Tax=Anas platyrhynchos platyrhynchos TaxID=8840 RepID=A0A493SVL1_ANAPP